MSLTKKTAKRWRRRVRDHGALLIIDVLRMPPGCSENLSAAAAVLDEVAKPPRARSPRHGFVPHEVTQILFALGWSIGHDGAGATVWYPPAIDPEARHHKLIRDGLQRIVRDIAERGGSMLIPSVPRVQRGHAVSVGAGKVKCEPGCRRRREANGP